MKPEFYKRRFSKEHKAHVFSKIRMKGEVRKATIEDFLNGKEKKVGQKFFTKPPWSWKYYEHEILKQTDYPTLRALIKANRVYILK